MGAAQGRGAVGWTCFGVTLSLATPSQGGGAGAVRAATNKKNLERAELLWLRATLVCQGVSSISPVGSRYSEQLENWQVAVSFSGKVVKRSVAVGRAGMWRLCCWTAVLTWRSGIVWLLGFALDVVLSGHAHRIME